MSVTRISAAVALLMTLASVSAAQIGFTEYEWSNPGGGDYATATNWTPTGVPNSNSERATFDLSATYAVTMPSSDVSVLSAAVPRGNVTLNFLEDPSDPLDASYSYTANLGLSVATSGQASLELVRANLTTGTATVGVNAGSDGRLTIKPGGDWISTGSVVIGAAGRGRLELQAGMDGVFTSLGRQSEATTNSALLGQSFGGSGRVDIAGVWHSGDLTVGNAGTGEVNLMTFSQGVGSMAIRIVGQLNSNNASIAAQPGSVGAVNVMGSVTTGFPFPTGTASTQWNVSGNLSIGGNSTASGGAGRLSMGPFNDVTVDGNLRIWSGGALSVRREFNPFSGAGKLIVVGTASLDGALEFVHESPDSLQIGDEFEIISVANAGVTGTFSSTTLTPLGIGRAWQVIYTPKSVWARVVAGNSFSTADFDQDGDVDHDDLARWRTNYGTGSMRMQGNADDDGDVDGADFLTWQRQAGFGMAVAAGIRIPEPWSVAMLTASFVLLVQQRSPRPRSCSRPPLRGRGPTFTWAQCGMHPSGCSWQSTPPPSHQA